ncbi:hypothetical protein GCM10008967_16800 [Bacillus carboniphilus]|uniref:SCP2 domain-containing protein n=1 Tax=Bacillus carboniphilus TaxID=86663 RepID=A0ABN0W6L9_9BACI
MKERVFSWLERLENRPDLQLLIPAYETFVSIESEKETVHFVLSKDKCKGTEDSFVQPDFSVHGDERSIYRLLSGAEMMQQLFKQKEITVKGKYRTLLLFESLCWLNKP